MWNARWVEPLNCCSDLSLQTGNRIASHDIYHAHNVGIVKFCEAESVHTASCSPGGSIYFSSLLILRTTISSFIVHMMEHWVIALLLGYHLCFALLPPKAASVLTIFVSVGGLLFGLEFDEGREHHRLLFLHRWPTLEPTFYPWLKYALSQ